MGGWILEIEMTEEKEDRGSRINTEVAILPVSQGHDCVVALVWRPWLMWKQRSCS
jgi:hypothetical protein